MNAQADYSSFEWLFIRDYSYSIEMLSFWQIYCGLKLSTKEIDLKNCFIIFFFLSLYYSHSLWYELLSYALFFLGYSLIGDYLYVSY